MDASLKKAVGQWVTMKLVIAITRNAQSLGNSLEIDPYRVWSIRFLEAARSDDAVDPYQDASGISAGL